LPFGAPATRFIGGTGMMAPREREDQPYLYSTDLVVEI
jgi:hypothetical protein